MDFQTNLESIPGIFHSPFNDPAEILVHPAALGPVMERHEGPWGLWLQWDQHCESILSGGRFTKTGHFCGIRRVWTRVRMWERNKEPQQSLVCSWTPASYTHQQSSGKRESIPTHAKPRQHQVHSTVKKKKKEKTEKEQEKMWRGKERWDRFWRPAPLPIVIRQLPSLHVLYSADVLPPCDLLLVLLYSSQKVLIYLILVFILFSIMYALFIVINHNRSKRLN